MYSLLNDMESKKDRMIAIKDQLLINRDKIDGYLISTHR